MKAIAVETRFWKPGGDFYRFLEAALDGVVEDGDVVTVSEKAVSTVLGRVFDESRVEPSRTSRFLARFWMRLVWGYVLGPVCRFRRKTIGFLRGYPVEEGSIHKQLVLQRTGLIQALLFGSEGGVDGSNLPCSYVSLPLDDAQDVAEKMRKHVKRRLGKIVAVVIVDTDKSYSIRGFHFTPRPHPVRGIRSGGGVFAFVAGRFLKLRRRATPVAAAGFRRLGVEEALEIAEAANRSQGVGAGRNVWDMARRFKVGLTGVSWEMLDSVVHKPVVIIRFEKALKKR